MDTGFLDTHYSLLSRTNLPTLAWSNPREYQASRNEDSSRSLPSGPPGSEARRDEEHQVLRAHAAPALLYGPNIQYHI